MEKVREFSLQTRHMQEQNISLPPLGENLEGDLYLPPTQLPQLEMHSVRGRASTIVIRQQELWLMSAWEKGEMLLLRGVCMRVYGRQGEVSMPAVKCLQEGMVVKRKLMLLWRFIPSSISTIDQAQSWTITARGLADYLIPNTRLESPEKCPELCQGKKRNQSESDSLLHKTTFYKPLHFS